MANRLTDPDVAAELLEHIRAGGKRAAAHWLGIARVTLDRWIRLKGWEYEEQVEQAMRDGHAWTRAARTVLLDTKLGPDSPTGLAAPPLPARRTVVDAEVVDGLPGQVPPLDFARSPPSKDGPMTRAELREHAEYAVRHPDHPFAREAFKMLFAVEFEPDMIRARREASAQLEGERPKVLRVPVPNPHPEGA